MNWMPSNLGAEPKKVGLLVAFVAIGGFVYLYNRNPSESPSSATPIPTRAPANVAPGVSVARSRIAQNAANSGAREFRPSLKIKNIEPSSIDPTLHLDLLAKLKTIAVDAGTRSLFEIAAAPAPLKSPGRSPPRSPSKQAFVGPMPPPPAVVPPEPKAPPIPLKFYGFVNKSKVGDKRAFFLWMERTS